MFYSTWWSLLPPVVAIVLAFILMDVYLSLLLVGYDESQFFFNDPWDHHGVIGYPKDLVKARHKAQYEMAVAAYRM